MVGGASGLEGYLDHQFAPILARSVQRQSDTLVLTFLSGFGMDCVNLSSYHPYEYMCLV